MLFDGYDHALIRCGWQREGPEGIQ